MDLEISAPATMTALLACSERIGHFGAAANLDPEVIARARIIVEELFSNTIKYGYGGECERQIRLRLRRVRGRNLTVVYEDDAPRFDPTQWEPDPAQPKAVESLREGEAGIALLFGLARTVAYQPRRGGNRLIVGFGPE